MARHPIRAHIAPVSYWPRMRPLSVHAVHAPPGSVVLWALALEDTLVLGPAREGAQVPLGLTRQIHPVEPRASVELLRQRRASMIMTMMPPGLSHALIARSLLEALVLLISSSSWMSHARRRLFELTMPGRRVWVCGRVESDECDPSPVGRRTPQQLVGA